jgi:hypothetical protein
LISQETREKTEEKCLPLLARFAPVKRGVVFTEGREELFAFKRRGAIANAFASFCKMVLGISH